MIQFYHEMEPLFLGIETSIELIDTQGSKKQSPGWAVLSM